MKSTNTLTTQHCAAKIRRRDHSLWELHDRGVRYVLEDVGRPDWRLHQDGVRLHARLSDLLLRDVSFYDSDGVFYVLGDSKFDHLGPLSSEAVCLIGGVVSPKRAWKPGSTEHRGLTDFSLVLDSLTICRARLDAAREDDSPDDVIDTLTVEALQAEALLFDLGFDRAGIELALRLGATAMHRRLVYEVASGLDS